MITSHVLLKVPACSAWECHPCPVPRPVQPPACPVSVFKNQPDSCKPWKQMSRLVLDLLSPSLCMNRSKLWPSLSSVQLLIFNTHHSSVLFLLWALYRSDLVFVYLFAGLSLKRLIRIKGSDWFVMKNVKREQKILDSKMKIAQEWMYFVRW